jgi:hypothetical protein
MMSHDDPTGMEEDYEEFAHNDRMMMKASNTDQ